MSVFIEVEVEEGDGIDEAVLLRFKQVTEPRAVHRVHYDGGGGLCWWTVEAVDDEARAALVEDSSDGEALLVFGGVRGLLLRGESGEQRRASYLLLARGTETA